MWAHRHRLPLALVAGIAAVGLATVLLRPREGLIEAAAVEPTAYFSAEQLERAREYRGAARLIALGGLAISGATLLVLALRPPRALGRLAERAGGRPLAGGAAVGAGISLVLAVVVLPLGVVAHERAVDVGLSTQGIGEWLVDRAKSAGIGAAMAALGGVVGVALVRRFPRNWWVPGGMAVIVASVAITYASPVLLDPLFNRFEPLPAGELRDDVVALADRAGVSVGEVYRVDASRRTTGANAYVGGLGETKRVVLYDNLIEDFPDDQVRSVVAHELGHVSNSDVPKGLLWLAIVALPATLLVQRLTERIERRGETRITRGWTPARGAPAVLPALALSLGIVSLGVQVAGNWLSRQVEARADTFALELTEEPAAFIGLQRSLDVQNVSEPDPPEAYHAIFGTHPTSLERIGFGLSFAEER
jgi:STE24 endopeptidase